jgi:non-ribosomal peptide synthetase-like protein
MKIGKGSEISTSFSGRYDLVEIGDNCFIADLCNLGEEEISRGWMHIGKVKVGNQVFIGNGAVIPMNTTVPDNALVGVQSRSPAGDTMKAGETWFGSPAIKLPVRQKFKADGEHWTFEPTRWMMIRRAIVEALNASFPTMLMISLGSACIAFLSPYVDDLDEHVWPILFFFIAMSTVISFLMMLASVAQKWLFMGVYKPQMNPMWSWWALRTEAVAVTYGTLASEILFEHLRGTPMLPWLLRLFGVKIGKGVFMDATDITEFDCVKIGDFSAVNAGACLQTHLYEDRLMKVGRIRISEGVTVGAGSTVLYDTRVGDNVVLGPVTLVMKGEELPANSSWIGSPAQPAVAQPAGGPVVVQSQLVPAAA